MKSSLQSLVRKQLKHFWTKLTLCDIVREQIDGYSWSIQTNWQVCFSYLLSNMGIRISTVITNSSGIQSIEILSIPREWKTMHCGMEYCHPFLNSAEPMISSQQLTD